MNELSKGQRERLAMLIEEAGEIVQIGCKIMRHGYDSYHPREPSISNRELLDEELTDLLAIAKRMVGVGDIEGDYELADINARWKRKLRYTHFQDGSHD